MEYIYSSGCIISKLKHPLPCWPPGSGINNNVSKNIEWAFFSWSHTYSKHATSDFVAPDPNVGVTTFRLNTVIVTISHRVLINVRVFVHSPVSSVFWLATNSIVGPNNCVFSDNVTATSRISGVFGPKTIPPQSVLSGTGDGIA